ncbi:DUF4115 domain-containing protein [Alteromonas sp. 5E99-2]|nr:DUF4115 domain-containing protein [Alteromonas sp. 5E99-2]
MSDENTEQIKPEINPGLNLKIAREQNGLSLEQVSQKLYIKADELSAIERNEINHNKSITFTKGYVKSYAKLVGLNVDSVIADFDTYHNRPEDTAKLQSFSRRVENEATDDRWMMVTYIMLLVILGGVVWWWLQQPDSSIGNDAIALPTLPKSVDSDAASPEVQLLDVPLQRDNDEQASLTALTEAENDSVESILAEPIEDKVESEALDVTLFEGAVDLVEERSVPESSVLEGNAEEIDSQETNTPEITVVSSEPEVIVDDFKVIESEETQTIIEETTESSSLVPVVFTFSQDCWVNIVDGSGEAIAYGVKKAGRVMEIEGVAPFTVTLGAPHVVNIVYDGETVDLSKFSGGQIAKFVLPVQG